MNRVPPIAKLAQRVLVDIENAVTRFSRKHRYTLGGELRAEAMTVARCIHKAWSNPEARRQHVDLLCEAIDDLKIRMQLAKQVNAFGSFAEFEAISRVVHELGSQSGGWKRKLHSIGQNAVAGMPSQRASILSSQVALEARS